MRNVIKDIEEQEKEKEKGIEQKDLLKTLIGVVEALEDSGGKVTKVVKPANVPVWVEKMDLKTYEKALNIWIEQNKDLSENQRFYEVIESLKMNKEVNGLAEYVVVTILPTLDTVEKQTVKNLWDKLKEKYGRTRLEEVESLVKEWMEFRPDDYDKA